MAFTSQRIIVGDCREVMAQMEPNSVDAIVTDPPAGISFMSREWDSNKGGRDQWVDWLTDVMRECHRVAKPGAHAFVWALPRTSGWTHRALEDAGWEVRDCVTHLFGSGFPKSLSAGKAIDRAAGAERETVGIAADFSHDGSRRDASRHRDTRNVTGFAGDTAHGWDRPVTAPATDLARQWDGWHTALKPAAEFWYLARKPLSEPNIAANVLTHGTGALNIDGCRIGTNGEQVPYFSTAGGRKFTLTDKPQEVRQAGTSDRGRWPSNVILGCHCPGETHDATCAVAMLDAQSGERKSGKMHPTHTTAGVNGRNAYGKDAVGGFTTMETYGDTGGASRFLYVAKASRAERGKNNTHPTVKPLALMTYLITLITPPGGTVLDPFLGSGSTLVAAARLGFNGIGVEQDEGYARRAERRIHDDCPMFADTVLEIP